MKRLFLFLLLALSFHLIAAQDEKANVLTLHNQKFEWLIGKNYSALEGLLHEDLQYIHSNGWIQSRQEVLDDLKTGKLNYTSVSVEAADAKVIGNTAIITGTGMFGGLMADKSPFDIRLLYTEVYIRQGKNWKLVSRQAVKLP